ncbi:hypothetical protein ACFYY8_29200 [Streptosporangium sp. NPDC001559]|uniref:hypothetical protein n=1 Tax=Streptosporangium sp. NPDC001559 TaxID=3366187 RepID=UPI0036E2FF4D
MEWRHGCVGPHSCGEKRCGRRSCGRPGFGTFGRATPVTPPVEQGVNIRVVQEVLGHTRVTTTARCARASTPPMRDAGERLASALWGEA